MSFDELQSTLKAEVLMKRIGRWVRLSSSMKANMHRQQNQADFKGEVSAFRWSDADWLSRDSMIAARWSLEKMFLPLFCDPGSKVSKHTWTRCINQKCLCMCNTSHHSIASS
jgi:hypothetical protein